MKKKKTKKNPKVLEKAASTLIAEELPHVHDQFQQLRNSVDDALEKLARKTNKRLPAIVVTGEAHGDGTSLVAINLAMSLSRNGKNKVLLVDADWRHPVVHTLFQLGEVPGFTDLLAGKSTPEEVILRHESSSIDLIPCGLLCNDQTELHLERLDALLAALKSDYGFIIFNSSPINKYSDTTALAPYLDAAILVIRAEITSWDGLERAKQLLELREVPILGVVMNRRKYFIPRILYRRFFI